MDRTLGANYDASTGIRLFKDGPPGTTVEYNWLNGVQEELINTIEGTAQTTSISDRTQVMQSVAMQGLGLRNGVIVPSVAGNNLTIAIKTLAGLDPSTTNPVYVRIGNTLRVINSALYVTVTGGTDDWDRTSYTFSVFVYLGYDSVNQRIEILTCPQPTYTTYPAANPAAPDARRLKSAYGANTGTSIANGHTMQIIGRVDGVVQSAGDNFTGVTATALSYPIFNTPIMTSPSVPLRSNAADTTPVFTTNQFRYSLNYNNCYIGYLFDGDGGADGVGIAGSLKLDIPFYADNGVGTIWGGAGYVLAQSWDGANGNALIHNINTANKYLGWYAGKLVAGQQLLNIFPSFFTAGNRIVQGNWSYPILL